MIGQTTIFPVFYKPRTVRHHSTAGVTVVELMISAAIFAIVFTSLASSFLFAQRLLRVTLAETETALAMRNLRERLLLRASPTLHSGLLTGEPANDGAGLTCTWTDTEEPSSKLRLVLRDATGGSHFFNERMPHNAANLNWLRPGGYLLQDGWSATVDLPRIKLNLKNPQNGLTHTEWILLPLPQSGS